MKTAVVIPARYASTRLPGKPLLRETGKYLVQHVYERACRAADVDAVGFPGRGSGHKCPPADCIVSTILPRTVRNGGWPLRA